MASRPRKNPYLVAIGRAIRERRERLGMSQEEFGFESGVHRTYVGGVERGERNPTVLMLEKLAHALDSSPARILQDAENR